MTENSENQTHEDYIELDQEQSPEPEATRDVINFNVNDQRIAEVKEEFKDVDAYKDMDEAKAAKKVLTKMRTTLAEAHKEQKAESLAYGRKLDGEKNRLLELIAEVEDPISTQITAIKNAAIIKEEARVGEIMGHIERLQSYSLDRHDLNVAQIKERRLNLAAEPLTEEIYQEMLGEAKMAHEEADSKLRIVLQRELDAIEEKEKQDKIAAENAERQKKLDDRQTKMDAEEADRKKKQEERDATARKEQEEKDAERQAELDEQAEDQRKEQKRLDDIAEADLKQQEVEDEAAAARARAPDRDKLLDYANTIDQLVKVKPTMESQEGANTMLFATSHLIELAETIRKCVEEMK